ncbi:MCE family protein [Aeromicrobium sp.]|jgi:phospholipid/cholesterol/gamma-HCH transport system substrate-binding protein|uniref:MCE family protein n=1 Tax=Aeromicrobium sp. TaxID=1871063 RepID=UPI00262547BB|nr:MCE family protein [Aeromicrobium sp.]
MTAMNGHRHLGFGLAFLLILGLIAYGVVAMYRGDFRSTIPVTVDASRAGLTMEQGAVVKLRGVAVGRVAKVSPAANGAVIDITIDAGQVKNVPADVTAQIVPPTAFGAKYVQLTAPTLARERSIAAGAVIKADRVTVEVNDAFSHLVEVLDAARPSEVNNALTALSTALDGRGDTIGQLVEKTDDYLASFNRTLPSLADDLQRSASVVDTYDQALPDLLGAAKNATVTSKTIVNQQASLHAFLISLTSFSESADTLVDTSAPDLDRTVELLAKPASVIARYSPEIPCVIQGTQLTNTWAEAVIGGKQPGIKTITTLQGGDEPYRTAENLPIIGNDTGPQCFGLPRITKADVDAPSPFFKTGANPYAHQTSTTPSAELSKTFFGTLAGLVNFLD